MRSKKKSLIDSIERNEGSCTVEACIILPVLISVLLFMIYVIRAVTALNCLDNAVLKTARLLSDYGILYHEYGLEELENSALEKIGELINEKTGDSTGTSVLFRFASLRDCAAYGDDLLYSKAAETICEYYLKKDPLVKNGYVKLDKLSFSGSTFFNKSDDVELRATARLFNFVKAGTSVRARAWIRGDNPLLAIDESGLTVWDMGNLQRGKILRTIFGANMPYDYPVIAIYDESKGEATVIKSLDVTAPYYNRGKGLERELTEMIEKFRKFETTDGYAIREGYQIIKNGDIKKKKMTLVMPTNEPTQFQMGVINSCMVKAASYNISLEIVTYQRSNRYQKQESDNVSSNNNAGNTG
jgi:hypothetical protein